MLSVDTIELDHRAYAARRPQLRQRLIPLRRQRRVTLGAMLAVEFENEVTLAYQIQEMAYVERLTDPVELAHEVEVYGRLAPGSHRLCATLFIELDDPANIRRELARLAGVQHRLRIEVAGHRVEAAEVPGLEQDPDVPSDTVSVHMISFTFTDAARDAFADPALAASLVVDHPAYHDDAAITGATRAALMADLGLAADPAS